MAEGNIFLCCGLKIWTRVVGSLEIIACILLACFGSMLVAAQSGEGAPDGEEGNQTEIIAGLWVAIVLTFILTVVLLVGNEKERAGFLIPWLVLAYISIVFAVLGTVGAIISGNGGAIVTSLFQIALQILFVSAVQKRYKEIKTDRTGV